MRDIPAEVTEVGVDHLLIGRRPALPHPFEERITDPWRELLDRRAAGGINAPQVGPLDLGLANLGAAVGERLRRFAGRGRPRLPLSFPLLVGGGLLLRSPLFRARHLLGGPPARLRPEALGTLGHLERLAHLTAIEELLELLGGRRRRLPRRALAFPLTGLLPLTRLLPLTGLLTTGLVSLARLLTGLVALGTGRRADRRLAGELLGDPRRSVGRLARRLTAAFDK